MKKNVCICLLLTLLVGFTSCGEGDNPNPTPSYLDKTVLVYMAADNNLSSFAYTDMTEIKQGMLQMGDKNVKLLVYMDTGTSCKLIELNVDDNQVTENIVREYLSSRNSMGVDEMKEVFADVFNNPTYQAHNYGLVFWSHAEGWIPYPLKSTPSSRWVGQDMDKGNNDKRMNVDEFVQVLQTAPHFDFILMDACFVQSVELAYEIRSFADYYIGSPTETPGPGAPYDKLIPAMFQSDNAALDMAEAYFKVYETLYNGGVGLSNNNWTAGVSMSVIKMSELDALASATGQALCADAGIDCATLRKSVFNYDRRPNTSSSHVGYYDFVEMMEILSADESSFATWKKRFDAALIFFKTTAKNYSSSGGIFSMENANGMSHYILGKSDAADAAYTETGWYKAAGLSKIGW